MSPKQGDRVTVKHTAYSYPLPDGLPAGAQVTLLSFDHGYWDVDYQGQRFKIFMTCIEGSGFVWRMENGKRVLRSCAELLPEADRPRRAETQVRPGCKPRQRMAPSTPENYFKR